MEIPQDISPQKAGSWITRIFFCGMLTLSQDAVAQTEHAWEKYLNEVMTVEDVGQNVWEDTYEQLCELELHPMDINRATREQLEELNFLSAQQVEDIMVYLYRYGPMKSLSELLMIPSIDYACRQLLSSLLYVGEQQRPGLPSLKDIARYGHSELMATASIPFYQRKGDKNGYLGYPFRHWLRYQFGYGDKVKLGVVGAQDAGEPLLSGRNRMGYDYYSFWLQLRNLGRLQTLVAGRYRVSMGMGLIANSSFGFGKVAMLQNLGRQVNTLRAHSSRSEGSYLQGAGATVGLSRHFSVTAFLSYRAMDATLNSDGSAATILSNGYHRTQTEMDKKNNLHNTTGGGSLRYQRAGFHAGLNLMATHLNRELKPDTTALYRRYYPRGYDFLNASASYGYAGSRLSASGETAFNRNGALATINSLSLQMGSQWSLVAVQRFYSMRYSSLYAASFSDGGRVGNESGLYLGLSWQPSPRLKLKGYADYAYFPWVRYQVSQSSESWDFLLQGVYTHRLWTIGSRYRLRLKQKDNEDKTGLLRREEHRARLTADYDGKGRWSSHTQVDMTFVGGTQREGGLMVSQTLGFTHGWLRLNAGFGYFRTDGYDSRVYIYEASPLYCYGITQFYGEGIRYWLMARAKIGKRLMLTAKAGTTNYFDRATIGSGYQQIFRSSKTDLDLQLRWKF